MQSVMLTFKAASKRTVNRRLLTFTSVLTNDHSKRLPRVTLFDLYQSF